MSARKNSIKTEYAPLFRILYWSTIGFFFAVIAWMGFEGFMDASKGFQEHNRVSEEYRQAVGRGPGAIPYRLKSAEPSKPKESLTDDMSSKEDNESEDDPEQG